MREFARTARGSHRSELDLDASSRRRRCRADAARLIRILRDLERSTMQRMRNLLVTATHKDARVTAFLTTWAFERFWIADALDYVLETAGEPPRESGHRTPRASPSPSGPSAADRSVARSPPASPAPQLVAAHVTAGLVDEWVVERRLPPALLGGRAR